MQAPRRRTRRIWRRRTRRIWRRRTRRIWRRRTRRIWRRRTRRIWRRRTRRIWRRRTRRIWRRVMTAFLIALQDLKRSVRDPVGLLMTLAVPLALIVAIGLVAGHTPFQRAPQGGFDALSYIAPGMALFFMMLSVRQSARIIAEDAGRGVRDRLRSAPVAEISITAGNTVSHIILLFLQLLVLIGISTLLYGLRWGPTGVLVLVCFVLAVCAS